MPNDSAPVRPGPTNPPPRIRDRGYLIQPKNPDRPGSRAIPPKRAQPQSANALEQGIVQARGRYIPSKAEEKRARADVGDVEGDEWWNGLSDQERRQIVQLDERDARRDARQRPRPMPFTDRLVHGGGSGNLLTRALPDTDDALKAGLLMAAAAAAAGGRAVTGSLGA